MPRGFAIPLKLINSIKFVFCSFVFWGFFSIGLLSLPSHVTIAKIESSKENFSILLIF